MELIKRYVGYVGDVMNKTTRRHVFSCASILVLSTMFVAATLLFQSADRGRLHVLETSTSSSNFGSQTGVRRPIDRSMKIATGCTNDVTTRNKERRQQLINGCQQDGVHFQLESKNSSDSLKSVYESIIVDDDRQLLYCAVPKVASTNWKRVMLMLTGKMNVTRLEDLRSFDVHHRLQNSHLVQLNRFEPDRIRTRLDTYFKFLFVRHPLERIVSAYENKFNTPYDSYFQVRYGTRIIRRYRSNPSEESLRRGHDVTFDEFVRYLGDYRAGKDRQLNEHWRPFSELCLPCQVRYDVIGKYETLGEDAQLVFDVISATATADKRANPLLKPGIHFPAGRKRANRTMDVLKRFATVSAKNFKLMSNVYADDFKLFGYGYTFNKNGTLSGYSAISGLSKHCA